MGLGCGSAQPSLDADGIEHRQRLELEERAGYEMPSGPDGIRELVMAVDDDTMVVGLAGHRVPSNDESIIFEEHGALAVFARVEGEWIQTTKLTLDDPPGEEFGAFAVVDGGTILASVGGATWLLFGPPQSLAVFEQRSRDEWALVSVLEDVACIGGLAIEGATAVVADRCERSTDRRGSTPVGRLRVLRRDSMRWRETQDLSVSRIAALNRIDSPILSQVIALDDGTVALGIPNAELATPDGEIVYAAGIVVLFEERDGAFVETEVIEPSRPEGNAFFGENVALSGDTMAISARGEGSGYGAVYLYERRPEGWVETARLEPSNRPWSPQFGWDLSLEGERLVVGTPLERSRQMGINNYDVEPYADQSTPFGAAYVFERRMNGWQERFYVKDRLPRDRVANGFGTATALSGDSLFIAASGRSVPAYIHVWSLLQDADTE